MWWCINFVDFTVWIWIFIWDNLTIESYSRIHATCDPFWFSKSKNQYSGKINKCSVFKMFAMSVRPCHFGKPITVTALIATCRLSKMFPTCSSVSWLTKFARTGPNIYVDPCSSEYISFSSILFWFIQGVYFWNTASFT